MMVILISVDRYFVFLLYLWYRMFVISKRILVFMFGFWVLFLIWGFMWMYSF